MAKKKQKYYVVWEGNNPGIYESWTECQLQIKGYPNARFKAFNSKEEATRAFREGSPHEYYDRKEKRENVSLDLLPDHIRDQIVWDSIAVDAACSGNPGIMEYRGVETKSGLEIFRIGPFDDGNNNVGEFLALVHGLAYLEKVGKSDTPIYSDSRTARSWVRNRKLKTNLKRTSRNKKLFELIERALLWLDTHAYSNEILTWDTDNWGEIPADFGRK